MHIFSPTDLKCTKLPEKCLQFFACGAHHLIIRNSIWGQNILQEGRGGNMNFKFNIHPCLLLRLIPDRLAALAPVGGLDHPRPRGHPYVVLKHLQLPRGIPAFYKNI